MRYTRETIVLIQRQRELKQLLMLSTSVSDKVLMENELYQVEASLKALDKAVQ